MFFISCKNKKKCSLTPVSGGGGGGGAGVALGRGGGDATGPRWRGWRCAAVVAVSWDRGGGGQRRRGTAAAAGGRGG